MAIVRSKDAQPELLVGKFICEPTSRFAVEFGWPAKIVSATSKTLTYRRLSRGEWHAQLREWRVDETSTEDVDTRCLKTSVRLICDTAKEAILLQKRSKKAGEQIQRVLQDVVADAVAGSL